MDVIEADSKDISINISHKKFVEMVVEFVGNKERLTYPEEGAFTLGLNDLEQFYYLLEAKIEDTSGVILDAFNAKFIFDNRITRTVTSFSDLQRFNEPRDIGVNGVVLQWYVITTEKKEGLKTQKVELSFDVVGDEYEGKVNLFIDHTNPGWGAEVLNLFRDQISNVIALKHPRYTFAVKALKTMTVQNYFGGAAIVIGIVFFSWLIFSDPKVSTPSLVTYPRVELINGYYSNKENEDVQEEYGKALHYLNGLHFTQIEKVYPDQVSDENVRSILEGYVEKKYKETERKRPVVPLVFILKVLILGFVLPFFAIYYLPKKYFESTIEFFGEKSFITVTKRSEKEASQYKYLKNNMRYKSISSVLISVAVGVVSCYIYFALSLLY